MTPDPGSPCPTKRRGWDSNPRRNYPDLGFQDRYLSRSVTPPDKKDITQPPPGWSGKQPRNPSLADKHLNWDGVPLTVEGGGSGESPC